MEQITLTIDGRQVVGLKGETILNIALANGIEIPNLCYHKELKIYGACGLCVVEAEGSPKLLRACATIARDGMVIHTQTDRVRRARKIALELIMSDHEGDCKGPCSLNCPAHTDCQGYLKKIAEGDDHGAVEIIKKRIPLPASIGRVCPHPCEDACRRQYVEEPLSIAYLKAFAADNDLASDHPYQPTVAPDSGKKAAIIGGGPAGLSAAYYLRCAGHAVTIYEQMPEMGGMLRYGIPEYRLPKKVLAAEVQQIEDLGVQFKNNFVVGRDATFEEITQSADATLVAIGAWQGSAIGCPGEQLEGVLSGIDFLRAVNEGQRPDLGKNVAVVGGGNTAMDACRTAKRCGAENVTVIYRRTRAEAPAEDLEITEAIEEGVVFKFLTNPAEIKGADGKVSEIKLQLMALGEPDASGRRRPMPLAGQYETIPVDTVISAIGQKCNPTGIDLTLTGKGTIEADEITGYTGVEGIFAVGDATNKGASIAIRAIGEADMAAMAMDCYLNNIPFDMFFKPTFSERKPEDMDFSVYNHQSRAVMPVADPVQRSTSFESVIQGFSDESARAEAGRCLECGCHAFEDCQLIRWANQQPLDPKRFEGEKHMCFKEQRLISIERDQGKCMLCNQCVRICKEVAGAGILGLVNRGFKTIIKPEFNTPETIARCKDCGKCAEVCPTGALKLI